MAGSFVFFFLLLLFFSPLFDCFLLILFLSLSLSLFFFSFLPVLVSGPLHQHTPSFQDDPPVFQRRSERVHPGHHAAQQPAPTPHAAPVARGVRVASGPPHICARVAPGSRCPRTTGRRGCCSRRVCAVPPRDRQPVHGAQHRRPHTQLAVLRQHQPRRHVGLRRRQRQSQRPATPGLLYSSACFPSCLFPFLPPPLFPPSFSSRLFLCGFREHGST